MAALMVHAAKGQDSSRTLYTSPTLAVANARILSKAGWDVHIADADGGIFHSERFDKLLEFRKPAIRF